MIEGEKPMQLARWVALASLGSLLAWSTAVKAETKVELKNVHLCCPACVKGVGTALKDIDGVKAQCDRQAKTVTITAPDDKSAQKALDALAKAGFHGKTGNKELAIKDDSGAKTGKVQSVTVSGVHNCCNACTRAIKNVVKQVDGVSGDTAAPKKDAFEVTGNFDTAELVKALNDAGFHVKVK
jgi:periplasmic mercuric ion binding protein